MEQGCNTMSSYHKAKFKGKANLTLEPAGVQRSYFFKNSFGRVFVLRVFTSSSPSGHNCELLPCEASNPCENGAVCVEELDQDHFPLGFRCRCRRGFSGPRCEINVDECSSSPCLHGFCYDGKKLPILLASLITAVQTQ